MKARPKIVSGRWSGVALATCAAAACASMVEPDIGDRRLGILQFGGGDSAGASVSAANSNDGLDWSIPPGHDASIPPQVIVASDTSRVGEPFSVTVFTVTPNGCWSADGIDVDVEGAVVELSPWDRNTGDEACTQALGFLPHDASVVFPEAGEWTLRVRGRRVRWDGSLDDIVTAERSIFVREPTIADLPIDVVLAPGGELAIGVFSLQFLEVVEDSRCPSDVVCVWEGNAAVVLGLTMGTGPTHAVTLNTTIVPRAAEHGEYRIELVGLAPSPTSTGVIDPSAYRATLRVEEASGP